MSNKINTDYSLESIVSSGLEKLDDQVSDKLVESFVEKAITTLSNIEKKIQSMSINDDFNVSVTLNLGILQVSISSNIPPKTVD